jgi:hypothetical protein
LWIKDLESDITEKRISRTANKRSPTANVDSFKKIFQQLKQPERRWAAAR